MTALYRLHKAAYLNDRHLQAGAQVAYAGAPGSYMEPLNEAAEKAHRKYAADRRAKKMAPLRYAFPFDGKAAAERSDIPEGAAAMSDPKSKRPNVPPGYVDLTPEGDEEPAKPPFTAPTDELVARAKELGGYSDEEWNNLPADDAQAALALAAESGE